MTYDPNWLKLWQRRFKDPLIDAETFRLTQKHEVAEIGGRPTATDEIEGQYMGLLSITPRGWQEIKRIRDQLISETRDTIHMTGILQKVIDAKRVKIQAVKNRDFWGEIDTRVTLKHSVTPMAIICMILSEGSTCRREQNGRLFKNKIKKCNKPLKCR